MMGRFCIRCQDGQLCEVYKMTSPQVAVTHIPGGDYRIVIFDDDNKKKNIRTVGVYTSEQLTQRVLNAITWAVNHMPFQTFRVPEDSTDV